jgi:hypothetical protein
MVMMSSGTQTMNTDKIADKDASNEERFSPERSRSSQGNTKDT